MHTLNPISILVVEDDEDLRQIISGFITGNRFLVSTAHSGQSALQKLTENPIHIVLSDIKMPEGNGYELMEAALKINKKLVFIFMTGYSEISEKDLIFGGAHRVLHKPFGKKELTQILNEEADKLALN